MNSVALLLVIVAGGCGVLASYIASWRALLPENRPALLGELQGCLAYLLVVSPVLGTVTFVYSAVFFLTPALFVPSEATILGVAWGRGGEALLCILYAALLTFSAFWLPLSVRTLQSKESATPVVLTLCGAGVAAGALAVAAFLLPAAAGGRGPALVLHRVAAGIFAGHAIVSDAMCWSCAFCATVKRRELSASLLGDPRVGDRRSSVNTFGTRERSADSSCSAWCAAHKRFKAMYTNPDWFSCWIGSFYFVACAFAVSAGGTLGQMSAPIPWTSNPLDSLVGAGIFNISGFSGAGIVDGILSLLFTLIALLLGLAPAVELCGAGGVKKVLPPFCLIFLIACFCRILGAQEQMRKFGLSASLWCLVTGILVTNIATNFEAGRRLVAWYKPGTKLGEFYIKIGLVLLCVELKTLVTYGVPGFVVAWGVTPIVLIFMWLLGTSGWLDCCGEMTPTLVMLVAAGTSICGTSAIAATRGCIDAPADEAVIAISLVSISTLIFMLTVPFFSLAVGLRKVVAGAWIGGAVNNTGNVVASAALLQDQAAEEVAAIVKMVQNALIGFATVFITFFWLYVVEPREAAKKAHVVAVDPSGVAITKSAEVTRPSLILLWDRFPKFVLGFFVLSFVTTILAQPWALGPALVSRSEQGPFLLMTEAVSDWWNLVGFVGLGAETDVFAMMKKVKGGSVILLYFCGQLFNVGLTLGVSWWMFQSLEVN